MAVSWLLPLLLLVIPVLAILFKKRLSAGRRRGRFPPGPPSVPIVGTINWLWHPLSEFEGLVRLLHSNYGPVVSLRLGNMPMVFVSDRRIAHNALVEQGTALADRRKPSKSMPKLFDRLVINASSYGPTWRLLRRNLVSETLHPSRIKQFAPARSWVLSVLIEKLRAKSEQEDGARNGVRVMEELQYAMFCLLVFMCFGERLSEDAVREIGKAQRDLIAFNPKANIFALVPSITKILFRKRLRAFKEMRARLNELYFPLIKARRNDVAAAGEERETRFEHSYLDTLLEQTLPEEGGRRLTDEEIVGLCSEFLTAGTDTTATGLEWIMAELVRNPDKQRKLYDEIAGATSKTEGEIKEEDLHGMPYLKAVVMEGLRRHPPAHFVLPHVASVEMEIGGYVIPQGTVVNFGVAMMGWDEEEWKNPMEFIPERFLAGGEGDGVDLTGSREIKMMPFGVGRRICAGINVAMLHLEYFVANMVKEFEWREVAGSEVDVLSEATELTVFMKKPLRAKLLPRS